MKGRTDDIHVGSPPIGGSTVSFADDVRYYLALSPRQLPSRYLYDPLGSALFEAICELPWYRITRAEAGLLAKHRDEVFAHLDRLSTLVELGSGNGEKLRTLLGAPSRRGSLTVRTIDVSEAALRATGRALADLDGVRIVTHETTYEDGLEALAGESRPHGQALALFLGSNIGNFDPPGTALLLRNIRAALNAGDGLLIGADLVKPEAELLLAYDDPLGVTAAFNLNLLLRINRELGGTFDINGFDHRAVWNESESRVEMHLVSRHAQKVRIDGAELEIEFGAGETIWTESSYKYRPDELIGRIERAAFRCIARWIDEERRFGLVLLRAI
jgi:dimethylhistidine N-methyltransferase